MTSYPENYIAVINQGLTQASYKILGKTSDAQEFFENLVDFTEKVQANNGRLFFFGNGASAAFSNHMALDWSKNG